MSNLPFEVKESELENLFEKVMFHDVLVLFLVVCVVCVISASLQSKV